MPVNDWTRVGQGTLRAFHCAWITEIQRALNSRVLPGYYVNVPLGPTYAAVFETLPAFWRAKLA